MAVHGAHLTYGARRAAARDHAMPALYDSRAVMCRRISQVDSAVAYRLKRLIGHIPFDLQKIADELLEILGRKGCKRDVKVYRDIEYSLVQILDLALCRRECIFDRNHDVLVFGRVAMSLADEDILMLRDRDANIDREQLAFAAPHRRCDDRHVTARYPVVEFFQPLGLSFSDRIVSEGLEFWKVISSGTCRETFPLRHFQS